MGVDTRYSKEGSRTVVKNVSSFLGVNISQNSAFIRCRISVVEYFDRSQEVLEFFQKCVELNSNLVSKSNEEIKSDEQNEESDKELSVVFGDPEVVKRQPPPTAKRNDYALSDFIDMEDYCESNSKFYKFRDKLDWPRGSMMFATLFLEFWKRFSAEEWTEFETMVAQSMREMDNGFFVQVQYFFQLWAPKHQKLI